METFDQKVRSVVSSKLSFMLWCEMVGHEVEGARVWGGSILKGEGTHGSVGGAEPHTRVS